MCVHVCSLDANITAGIDSGIVIAVPIPQHAALLGEEIEQAILLALQEAKCKPSFCLVQILVQFSHQSKRHFW